MRLKDVVGVCLVTLSVLAGLYQYQADAMSAPNHGEAHLLDTHIHTGHAPTHASEHRANPASRCHDTGERCCTHAMTCCVIARTPVLGWPALNGEDAGTLTPQNHTPCLPVPKLPPRA